MGLKEAGRLDCLKEMLLPWKVKRETKGLVFRNTPRTQTSMEVTSTASVIVRWTMDTRVAEYVIIIHAQRMRRRTENESGSLFALALLKGITQNLDATQILCFSNPKKSSNKAHVVELDLG